MLPPVQGALVWRQAAGDWVRDWIIDNEQADRKIRPPYRQGWIL
jgi:hypothetical protein